MLILLQQSGMVPEAITRKVAHMIHTVLSSHGQVAAHVAIPTNLPKGFTDSATYAASVAAGSRKPIQFLPQDSFDSRRMTFRDTRGNRYFVVA